MPKSQIPNPKSQTAAEIPNCCRNPKPLPKSQTVAEIPNRCRNPKPSKTTFFHNQFHQTHFAESTSPKGLDFSNVLGFRQWCGISATVWDFGNGLGFRQQF